MDIPLSPNLLEVAAHVLWGLEIGLEITRSISDNITCEHLFFYS